MFEQTSALLFKNSFPRVPHIQCVIDGPQDADVSPVSPALTHALSILFFNPVFCKKNKTNTQQNSERDFHKGWGLYTKESLAWAQLWLWVWMFACQCEDGRCVQVVMPCLRILAKDKMKKGSIGEWVWWRIEDVCKLIMPLNVPASQ